MTTQQAKIALLSYCRFARQYHYVATEVPVPGCCSADVLASNGNDLIEYEVKVSMSDLSKDSEKPKHAIYNSSDIIWNENIGIKGKDRVELRQGMKSWQADQWSVVLVEEGGKEKNISGWRTMSTLEEAKKYAEDELIANGSCPNVLYYVIPTLMWEKHEEKIRERIHPSYGVITFSSHNYHEMSVVKKAKKLHKKPVNPDALKTLVARMGSELATLTMAHYRYLQNMTEYGKIIGEKFDLQDMKDEE